MMKRKVRFSSMLMILLADNCGPVHSLATGLCAIQSESTPELLLVSARLPYLWLGGNLKENFARNSARTSVKDGVRKVFQSVKPVD